MTRYYFDCSTPQGANDALDYSRLFGEVWPLLDYDERKHIFEPNAGWSYYEEEHHEICGWLGIPEGVSEKLYLPTEAAEALLDEKGQWKPLTTDEIGVRHWLRQHPITDSEHPLYGKLMPMPGLPKRANIK